MNGFPNEDVIRQSLLVTLGVVLSGPESARAVKRLARYQPELRSCLRRLHGRGLVDFHGGRLRPTCRFIPAEEL